MAAPYLLDTNILVHLIRDDDIGLEIRARYDPFMTEEPPALCIVSCGEIRSLAYQFGWGDDKLSKVSFFLSYFRRLAIDTPDVLEAYAIIDSHSKIRGVTMGKNDVWIAAAANTWGFTIVTTDRDFLRIAPDFVEVELVGGGLHPR